MDDVSRPPATSDQDAFTSVAEPLPTPARTPLIKQTGEHVIRGPCVPASTSRSPEWQELPWTRRLGHIRLGQTDTWCTSIRLLGAGPCWRNGASPKGWWRWIGNALLRRRLGQSDLRLGYW